MIVTEMKKIVKNEITEIEFWRNKLHFNDNESQVYLEAYNDILNILNGLEQDIDIMQRVRRYKTKTLIDNLYHSCLCYPTDVFDIPKAIIEYIIDKDIDLSSYYYDNTVSHRNKQIVVFYSNRRTELIVLMLVHKWHSYKIHPCSLKKRFLSPSFSNVKPIKNIPKDATGNRLKELITNDLRTMEEC